GDVKSAMDHERVAMLARGQPGGGIGVYARGYLATFLSFARLGPTRGKTDEARLMYRRVWAVRPHLRPGPAACAGRPRPFFRQPGHGAGPCIRGAVPGLRGVWLL